MFEEFIIRPADISDANQFVEIMNDQYARKKTVEYFQWQYIHPFEPTVLMCVFKEDRMIGSFGLKLRELNTGAKAGQAIDMLIVPSWRKKGLFRALVSKALQYFEREIDILCVLANAAGKHAVQKSLDWFCVSKINALYLRKMENEYDVSLREEVIHDQKDRVYFKRSQRYRRWRFDENPEYSYSPINIEDDVAWTKLYVDPGTGKRYGDIVDILSPENSVTRMRNIYRAVYEYFTSQCVESITTWAMPGTVPHAAAESIGFKEMSQERYFCVKIMNPKYEHLKKIERWHLVQADSEIY